MNEYEYEYDCMRCILRCIYGSLSMDDNLCEKCLAQEYCERLLEGIKNIEKEYAKKGENE